MVCIFFRQAPSLIIDRHKPAKTPKTKQKKPQKSYNHYITSGILLAFNLRLYWTDLRFHLFDLMKIENKLNNYQDVLKHNNFFQIVILKADLQ